MSGPVAALAMVLLAVTISTHTLKVFGAVPVAYLCLVTATVLSWRLRKVGFRNDLSHGVYLYGFPVQQLPFLAGASQLSPLAFVGLACIAVLLFAAMSWLLVERPAMRMKTYGRREALTHRTLPGTVA